MDMEVAELEKYLGFILVTTVEDGISAECNYCSIGDYHFSDRAHDLGDLAEPLIRHVHKHHANEVAPSEEEIARVFGIRTLTSAPPRTIFAPPP